MSRAVDAFPPPPSSPPPPEANRGAAHRIVEVAFCCAPLSRAVDAFSLLSAVQDSSWMQSFIVHQQAENNAARITLFSVEMLPTTEEEYSLMSPTGSTTDQLNPHVRLRYPSQKLRNPRYQRARRGDCVSKLSPAEADRIPCSFSPCAQCNRAGQHVVQRTPICSVCGDDQLAERAAHAQCRLGRFKVWSTHGKEPAPRKRGPHVWRGIPEDWQNFSKLHPVLMLSTSA